MSTDGSFPSRPRQLRFETDTGATEYSELRALTGVLTATRICARGPPRCCDLLKGSLRSTKAVVRTA